MDFAMNLTFCLSKMWDSREVPMDRRHIIIFTNAVNPISVNMRNWQLPNIVINACSNIKENSLQRLCLFMFWLIALKPSNSLTSIDTFSCLSGLEVMHQNGVQEVPSSITGTGKLFYVCIFVLFFDVYVFVPLFPFIMKFLLQCYLF